MDKFPIPQAERLIGDFSRFNSRFYNDTFSRVEEVRSGEVITDPQEVLRRLFNEYSTEPIPDLEIEKSERDHEIIKIARDAVKKIATDYGRETFVDFTPEHIHFLKDGGTKEYTDDRLEYGSHSTLIGEILIDRRDDLATAITTFHELWHAIASHTAIQVTVQGKLDWYRSGFSILSRDGKKRMFHNLDEALTGYATKRFVTEVLKQRADFSHLITLAAENGGEIDTTRQNELDDFLTYIDALYVRNKDMFANRDEILDMFMRAQVTGNLLPPARLVTSTFGKDAFRDLSAF